MFQTFWVTTWTPETESTTTRPASTAGRASSASCTNMLKPGVSMRLNLSLPHSTAASEAEMVIWRAISSSS
jgi:hypothetical protein